MNGEIKCLCSHNGMWFSDKEEWNTDTGYNMFENVMPSERSLSQRTFLILFTWNVQNGDIYIPTDKESWLVVA